MQKIPAPENKTTKKTTDLPKGEYICKRFATTTFRKAPRTIMFLLPLGEDGEQATDEETPTHGFFLEKEIEAIGGHRSARKKKNPIALPAWRGEDNTKQKKVPQSCPSIAFYTI